MNIKQLIVEHALLKEIKAYCVVYDDDQHPCACNELCPFYDAINSCKLWECAIIIMRHQERINVDINEEVIK